MSVQIRCPNCKRFFGAPDLESVRTYAAGGGIIQTLTERIVLQPIIKHYRIRGRFFKAMALPVFFTFIGPAEVMYFGISSYIAFGLIGISGAISLVIVGQEFEEKEIEDKPDDEPQEPEPQSVAPQPFIEVTKPGPNSLNIRVAHEPPANPNPVRQRTLGQADIAMARLATGDSPITPVSWSNVKRAGYRYGEKTFYEIQRRWIREGLAYRSENGAVYLKGAGRRILSQYAQQAIN